MSFVVRNLAACIRRGQQEGSLLPDLLPDETASALYSLWVGSALLFKTQHSRAPLLAAMAHTQQILRAP
ncbi:hypothetical protein C3F00_035165 [Pseudomonas sp. MWU13-2860]|nr:hypothetical protein C3F00_035165 [Pseudomonas sp. MWU13-2860]